jgi:DNA-directed RNA polymerase subunit RPC12/RpoP
MSIIIKVLQFEHSKVVQCKHCNSILMRYIQQVLYGDGTRLNQYQCKDCGKYMIPKPVPVVMKGVKKQRRYGFALLRKRKYI